METALVGVLNLVVQEGSRANMLYLFFDWVILSHIDKHLAKVFSCEFSLKCATSGETKEESSSPIALNFVQEIIAQVL